MDIPNSCDCEKCRNMCKIAPCIPTPRDVQKLIDAGFKSQLKLTYWGVGMILGTHKKPILIIAPEYDEDRKICTFNVDGLCSLHDLKLKPLEGKLAHHSDLPARNLDEVKEKPLFKIISQWEKLTETQIINILL